MLFVLLAVAAYVGYRYWNHRLPTDDVGRLRRAAAVATTLGVITMPWMWWSGLPEAALIAGVVALIIAWRRDHPDHARA